MQKMLAEVKIKKQATAETDIKALKGLLKMGRDMWRAGYVVSDVVSRSDYHDLIEIGKEMYEIENWDTLRMLPFRDQRRIVKMLLGVVDAYMEYLNRLLTV